ncbi:hypothetical protein KSP40_PGU002544 [Platanthera guangdongensis]|uniref:phosphatidate cytidylyltransferase n=1 Tax=Platanthera guangdongensis TaxID=2320717 RepID=A0ABR2MGQ4_9ASPA
MNEPRQHKEGSQVRKRVLFGLIIGVGSGGLVLSGGWMFTVLVAVSVFAAAREYFDLVRRQGIAAGMMPPPRYMYRGLARLYVRRWFC